MLNQDRLSYVSTPCTYSTSNATSETSVAAFQHSTSKSLQGAHDINQTYTDMEQMGPKSSTAQVVKISILEERRFWKHDRVYSHQESLHEEPQADQPIRDHSRWTPAEYTAARRRSAGGKSCEAELDPIYEDHFTATFFHYTRCKCRCNTKYIASLNIAYPRRRKCTPTLEMQ